jgi:hypothetical protein
MMWGNGCCYNGTVTGGLLKEAPTTADSNYPIPYLGWTEDGKAFLHIGSGNWITLPGGGGSGVDSVNGQKGAITIAGTAPIEVKTSGTTVTISTTAYSTGIQSIELDEGTLDESAVQLKGDTKQGVKTTITSPSMQNSRKKK